MGSLDESLVRKRNKRIQKVLLDDGNDALTRHQRTVSDCLSVSISL